MGLGLRVRCAVSLRTQPNGYFSILIKGCFMKILIPVDGSVYSDNAVAFVASRTTLIGHEPHIVLLNVQAPLPARASRLVSREALLQGRKRKSL